MLAFSLTACAYVANGLYRAICFNPRLPFGQGASEASGTLAITKFTADYESADLAHAANS